MAKPHTPEEIRAKLRTVAAARKRGATLAGACKKAGISPSSYRRWRQQDLNGDKPARKRSRAPEVERPGGVLSTLQKSLRRGFSGPKILKGLRAAVSVTTAFTETIQERVIEAAQAVVATIPDTDEIRRANPDSRCEVIIHGAAIKAATTSGGLSIPLGPLAIFTILPDLILVWKIQAQMVADLAGVFGKKGALTREHMLYCLFKHAASQVVRDTAVRAAERLLTRRGSMRLLRKAIGRVSLPVIGALGGAAYAYYDTVQVGRTAVALFKSDLQSA